MDMGLITTGDFANTSDIMNAPMNRQEMSMVLVRAMDALGEDTSAKVSKDRIPDYNKECN